MRDANTVTVVGKLLDKDVLGKEATSKTSTSESVIVERRMHLKLHLASCWLALRVLISAIALVRVRNLLCNKWVKKACSLRFVVEVCSVFCSITSMGNWKGLIGAVFNGIHWSLFSFRRYPNEIEIGCVSWLTKYFFPILCSLKWQKLE